MTALKTHLLYNFTTDPQSPSCRPQLENHCFNYQVYLHPVLTGASYQTFKKAISLEKHFIMRTFLSQHEYAHVQKEVQKVKVYLVQIDWPAQRPDQNPSEHLLRWVGMLTLTQAPLPACLTLLRCLKESSSVNPCSRRKPSQKSRIGYKERTNFLLLRRGSMPLLLDNRFTQASDLNAITFYTFTLQRVLLNWYF